MPKMVATLIIYAYSAITYNMQKLSPEYSVSNPPETFDQLFHSLSGQVKVDH